MEGKRKRRKKVKEWSDALFDRSIRYTSITLTQEKERETHTFYQVDEEGCLFLLSLSLLLFLLSLNLSFRCIFLCILIQLNLRVITLFLTHTVTHKHTHTEGLCGGELKCSMHSQDKRIWVRQKVKEIFAKCIISSRIRCLNMYLL